MNRTLLRFPLWVWILSVALSAPQPFLIWWAVHFPPDGMVSTGLHIQDSALFLGSMPMFENGFHSFYATCKSAFGDHALAFYPVPHLWLYGALGVLNRLLQMSDLMLYGCANAVGGLVYLLACYALLHAVVPKYASRAFVLFTLSGGLGGILYLATGLLGLHDAAQFELYFKRFACYELMEGPHLLPILLMPRCYYTLSLGLCLGALALLVKTEQAGDKTHWRRRFALMSAMLIPGVFIDLRYGVFTLGVTVLYLLFRPERPWQDRIRYGLMFFIPMTIGAFLAILLMRTNRVVIENHYGVTGMEMWLTPFLTVAVFHLVTISSETFTRFRNSGLFLRLCIGAGAGYLGMFAVLFALYQVYYGNLLVARDGAAAIFVSDWALIGAVLGLVLAWRWPSARNPLHEPHDWTLAWFLLYLAVSLSAWGQGWFLRFGPQRMEVLLWLPMCVLSAAALERWNQTRPLFAKGMQHTLIGCGVCSILVATFCFQGSFFVRKEGSPYRAMHTEVMTLSDDRVMKHLGEGMVLAPICASDVIVRQHKNPVVFGTGTMNMTDQPYAALEAQVNAFYAANTAEAFRKAFVEEWEVDYVYCSDTWPSAAETVAQLRASSWLEEVASDGAAALFRVNLKKATEKN